MNHIVFVSIFIFGMITSACPDLSGNWTCYKLDNSNYFLSVTQEITSSGTIYHFLESAPPESLDLLADGKPYPFNDGQTVGSVTGACKSKSVLTVDKVVKEVSGQFSYETTTVMTKVSSDYFDISSSGKLEIPGQYPVGIGNRLHCSR